MKRKGLMIVIMVISSRVYASEEDLFKRLEKEVRSEALDHSGIQQYKNFMAQMMLLSPDDHGNRELGYVEPKTKLKKVRTRVDDVEYVSVQRETFHIFKGFRVSDQGAVSISKNLDIEQFDESSPAIIFLGCIAEIFSQNIGRIEIPVEEDGVVKFWQPRSKCLILGCCYDKNGLPKSVK